MCAQTPREQVDLSACNSLRLPVRAQYFVRLADVGAVPEAMAWARRRQLPTWILGGGSNLVPRADWPGLTVQLGAAGVRFESAGRGVRAEVQAGHTWDALVAETLKRGLTGLECLSGIPGTVGAAPMQNIGAYGAEVGSLVEAVYAVDRRSGKTHCFSAQDCRFGYRTSRFKQDEADAWVITRVVLRLRTGNPAPLDHPEIQAELVAAGAKPSGRAVREAVLAVRRRKLPDPKGLPNVGSFFHNPVIDAVSWRALEARFPGLVSYPEAAGHRKLAAGWMIDALGWKGRRCGAFGVHEHQALVLVHHGGGTGAQLLEFAQRIQADVLHHFGVALEIEPRVYPV